MKKLFGLVVLSMVCLLSACSMFTTLDTKGNVTITHKFIEMKTVDYSHTEALGIQSIIVKISFENTKDEEVEFILENAKRVNKSDDEDEQTILPVSLDGLFAGKSLNAGQKVTYTFTTTFLKDTDVEDYELNFDLNGKTFTVTYKNEL